jgi:hypothetical protein
VATTIVCLPVACHVADEWTVAQLTCTCDPSGPLAGTSFTLTLLPPEANDHAEFLVLRSRFDAAVQAPWVVGDRVQVGTAAGREG